MKKPAAKKDKTISLRVTAALAEYNRLTAAIGQPATGKRWYANQGG